jgi:hypothetical protein
MPKLNGAVPTFLALAAGAFLSLASAGCKSSSTAPANPLSSIVVTNVCGASVILYADGVEKTTLETGSLATLSSVTPGSRLLEAKKADDGFLVYSETLTIPASTTNYVTIRGGASIRVTNQSGQILRISLDDAVVGDIGDQITLTISKVPFGSHTYQAKTLVGGTLVSEFTVDVTDFSEFTWTITP